MIAIVGDMDARIIAQESARVTNVTVIVTPGTTVSTAIVETLRNSSYVCAETEPVPKPNIFDTKYSRQRDWWNTPKKERRRKK
ncbi:hypothetical protein [Burkholderia phage FLC9]|nr:hypothetical protein [Burkholderia phage FLC9]